MNYRLYSPLNFVINNILIINIGAIKKCKILSRMIMQLNFLKRKGLDVKEIVKTKDNINVRDVLKHI